MKCKQTPANCTSCTTTHESLPWQIPTNCMDAHRITNRNETATQLSKHDAMYVALASDCKNNRCGFSKMRFTKHQSSLITRMQRMGSFRADITRTTMQNLNAFNATTTSLLKTCKAWHAIQRCSHDSSITAWPYSVRTLSMGHCAHVAWNGRYKLATSNP